jgi:chromosome partitioning protein
MKIITFFNNKGGVGKTSFVYHLAWMLGLNNYRTLAVDLDPQSNLTSIFLPEEKIESLWKDDVVDHSMLKAIQPVMDRMGDVILPEPLEITPNIGLIPGDLRLGDFEDYAADAWRDALDPKFRLPAMRALSAFYKVIQGVGKQWNYEFALVDVGPSIGALNRISLLSSDHVVIPLGPDLFSLIGLKNLGLVLKNWKEQWLTRVAGLSADLDRPPGNPIPMGYVLLNPSMRDSRPVKAYQKWVDRIPGVYSQSILGQPALTEKPDPNCLAIIKHYKSLMPMAMDAGKPMFSLTPADGAIGGHANAVQDCYKQYCELTLRILELL